MRLWRSAVLRRPRRHLTMVRHEVATEEPRTKQVKTARLPPSRRKACLQWLGWAGEGRPSPLCPAVIRIRPLKVSVDCGLPAVTFGI